MWRMIYCQWKDRYEWYSTVPDLYVGFLLVFGEADMKPTDPDLMAPFLILSPKSSRMNFSVPYNAYREKVI